MDRSRIIAAANCRCDERGGNAVIEGAKEGCGKFAGFLPEANGVVERKEA